ncbi:MAG: DNA repair protein RecN [Desulfatibacillaceae bacterium]
MLAELSIRNFAIIDDLRVSFSDGLTTITGETGAGKSILVNAVNLLLGAKATANMVRTGADTAELEALFDIPPDSPVGARLLEEGYDLDEGLLVQRIVAINNRHRTFVNGRLANMQMLSGITRSLASICGQHAHQDLLREDRHLDILDGYAGLWPLRREVARLYGKVLEARAGLDGLAAEQKRLEEERDLLEFQKNEIESAEVRPGEDQELEAEKRRLKNATALFEAAHFALEQLHEANGSAVERLGEAQKRLEGAAALDGELAPAAEAAANAFYGVEDAVERLRDYLNSADFEEGRLDRVEERLYELSRLKRKYGGGIDSILAHLDTVSKRLEAGENRDVARDEAKKRLEESAGALADKAGELSEKRAGAAKRLGDKVQAELADLNMRGARFEVRLTPLPCRDGADSPLCADGAGIDASGMERASFLISPNVGEDLRPLKDIASGGELSRVVLCLRTILAETDSVGTFVFDEVDAGIGGSTADVVGEKLAVLAKTHQVLCITHLPQIARFGHHHYRITKSVREGRTRSEMELLADGPRVEELARMLAGGNVSDTSRRHARELLDNAAATRA